MSDDRDNHRADDDDDDGDLLLCPKCNKPMHGLYTAGPGGLYMCIRGHLWRLPWGDDDRAS